MQTSNAKNRSYSILDFLKDLFKWSNDSKTKPTPTKKLETNTLNNSLLVSVYPYELSIDKESISSNKNSSLM